MSAAIVKPRKDDEFSKAYPYLYVVKYDQGGFSLLVEYLGKSEGLEAAVEKHFRKSQAYYFEIGHIKFKSISCAGLLEVNG